MKRFTGVKGTLILLVLVGSMVAYYGYLSSKSSQKAAQGSTVSKVQSVLLRDLELNYPSTVREVVKYFGDITLCLFSGSCDENDIDKLAAKLFQLFDGELAENNSWADYLVRLHGEIDEYQKAGQTVTGYAPAGSANVNFFDQDGYEWARLYCTFYIKTGKESKVTNQIFLLRKDADRHWKIYGWDLAENVDLTQEETVTEEN